MSRIVQQVSLAMAMGILGMILVCGTADAGSFITLDDASPEQIVTGMSTKAMRGIANIATGWVEFPKQIYLTFDEDGVLKGFLLGPFKGIGMTITRTVSGVLELATFYLAIPGFYDPYMDPGFVWEMD